LNKHKGEAGTFDELRRRAENWLGGSRDKFAAGERNPAADTHRLIHELHVHQIELEMQNEELQRVQAELENGLARLTDLYEFAPVGYMTMDSQGVLRDVNLAGARMMGLERTRLVGRRFAHVLAVESRSAFSTFLAKAFESRTKEIHETMLCPEGAEALAVELAATVADNGQECLLVATDITKRKRAEQVCKELQLQLAQSRKIESFGTLVSGIVHDIDGLLDGIASGLSTLELKRGEAGEHRQEIEQLEALAERGHDLTKRLLGLACGVTKTS
jgi:PAS domain S-box-containing protein